MYLKDFAAIQRRETTSQRPISLLLETFNPSLAEHDIPCLSTLKKPTDLDLHCLSLNLQFLSKPGSSNLNDWKLELDVAS